MIITFACHMLFKSGIGTNIRGLVQGWSELKAEGNHIPELHFVGDLQTMEKFPLLDQVGTLHHNPKPLYSWRWRLLYPQVPGSAGTHHLDYDIPAFLRRHPYIVTAHDMTPFIDPEFYAFNFHRPTHQFLVKMTLQGARHLIAPTHHSANDIMSTMGIPRDRITIIPNAVHHDWKPVLHTDVEEARASLHLPRHYVLTVGINMPHKNLRWMIESFAKWPGSKDTALVLAGARSTKRFDVDNFIRERGYTNIISLGYVDHELLPALYQGATALVFPSLYEGFGIPIIEAQKLGVPVIASNTSCIPEVAGEGALYFDPRSETELHKQLDEVLQEQTRTRLIAAGIVNEARFSWKDIARQTTEVYANAFS